MKAKDIIRGETYLVEPTASYKDWRALVRVIEANHSRRSRGFTEVVVHLVELVDFYDVRLTAPQTLRSDSYGGIWTAGERWALASRLFTSPETPEQFTDRKETALKLVREREAARAANAALLEQVEGKAHLLGFEVRGSFHGTHVGLPLAWANKLLDHALRGSFRES